MSRFVAVILGSLVALSGMVAQAQGAEVQVPVTLGWAVDGRAAWLYLGLNRGYFAQEGLNVRVHRGYGDPAAALTVDQGLFVFGVNIDLSAVINMRHTKSDIKGVMVVEARSPIGFQAFAEKGVRTPRDFEGHSIGLQPGTVGEKVFPILAKINGVDLGKVRIVSLSGDVYVPTFMAGRVDLISGFYDALYPVLFIRTKKAGKPLTAVWAKDWGLDTYGSMIVAKERTLREQPDLVRRFLAAARRSWDAAKADPAGAIRAMIADTPELDAEIALAQWTALLEIAEDKLAPPGCASPQKLQQSIDTYREAFNIPEAVAARDILTTEFLSWCKGQ